MNKCYLFSLCTAVLALFLLSSCNKDDDSGGSSEESGSMSFTIVVDDQIPSTLGSSVNVSIDDVDEELLVDDVNLKAAFYTLEGDTLAISGTKIIEGTDTATVSIGIVLENGITTGSYQISNGFENPGTNLEAIAVAYHTGLPEEILFFIAFGDYTDNSTVTISAYNADDQTISGNFNFGIEAQNEETGAIETVIACENGVFNNIPFYDVDAAND